MTIWKDQTFNDKLFLSPTPQLGITRSLPLKILDIGLWNRHLNMGSRRYPRAGGTVQQFVAATGNGIDIAPIL
ncbi:hypothetical protein E4U58_000810 [Claviceps cyperi]|nr:hypothetical protein E4U58_000810 [Claviceps cyperi]